MSVTVTELFNSGLIRGGLRPQDRLRFLLRGSNDKEEMRTAVKSAADALVTSGLFVSDYGIEEQAGDEIWVGSAQLDAVELAPKDPGEVQVSFDTSGGTEKICRGYENNVPWCKSGDIAPPTGKLIGVTEDSVEGVDIVVPKFEFQETWVFDDSAITPSFVDTLFRTTGTVNNADFRHMSAYECLCLGVCGTRRPDKNDPTNLVWDLTFKFSGSPTETDIDIGDSITVGAKLGWDYLWLMYEKTTGGTPTRGSHKIVAAYVSRVYRATDFSGLGIGQ